MTIDTTIIASCIAGVFGIVGALLPILILRWNKARRRMNRNLSKVLPGNWVGKVIEDESDNGQINSYDVTWDIKIKFSNFVAVSSMRYKYEGSDIQEIYTLHGKVIYDRFIQFEYENNDEIQINFGTEILQINDIGDQFTGNFVGYSSDNQKLLLVKYMEEK